MTADEHTVPEFRLDVGGSAIALRCPQPGLAEGLATWFGVPSADPAVPVPVSLELTLVAHDDSPSFPRSLLTTKRLLPLPICPQRAWASTSPMGSSPAGTTRPTVAAPCT
ncbi:MAG: hypothetical protein IPI48_02425 [bacterium]|nr:hypothetical protein [bacterium]